MRVKRAHWVLLLVLAGTATAVSYALWTTDRVQTLFMAREPILPGPRGVWANRHYVGIEACQQCHAERADSFRKTSHFLSMRLPDADQPIGYFPASLKTHRSDVSYEAQRRGDGLFVTSFSGPPDHATPHTEQIAMVMGSGKLSHSPFYRQGDKLFQMPMFFFSPLGEWMQVPGFLDLMPYWDRAIKPRCLDCHATFVEHIPGTKNSYRFDNMILSISCERCHGRGSDHVSYHRAHPDATDAVAIVNPQTLNRQRQLEVCGQCHGEIGKLKRTAFSYTPGEPLEDYVHHDPNQDDSFVRSANQLQRLELARCYQQTETMVCTTCHDPHALERENLPVFSQRCAKCHDASEHPQATEIGPRLVENCIDCHMPKRDDEIVPFRIETGERVKLIQMRDHLIGIYPTESQAMRAQWAKPAAPLEAHNSRKNIAHRRMADSWVRHAKSRMDHHDPAGVVDSLKHALHYEPEDRQALAGLGQVLAGQGSYEDAARYAQEALAHDATSIPALQVLALSLTKVGEHEEAIARYRALLELQPDSAAALNGLAWILATSGAAELRNGAEAVRLAEQLCRTPDQVTWSQWDTIAAAYAEAGQFDRAIECAQKAVTQGEAASPRGAPAVQNVRQRLERYRRGEPYHDPPRAGKARD